MIQPKRLFQDPPETEQKAAGQTDIQMQSGSPSPNKDQQPNTVHQGDQKRKPLVTTEQMKASLFSMMSKNVRESTTKDRYEEQELNDDFDSGEDLPD